MNKNMNTIAKTLPDANSDNGIEAGVGKAWEALSTLTGGILPSNENNGGLLAQIPVLTGTYDSSFKVIQVVSEGSDKYIENKGNYEKMEDSNYYKALSDKDKKRFDVTGLYVSKEPVTITEKTATFQNATNGIRNNEIQAIINGLQQTGQFNAEGIVELNQLHNPTNGFFADSLETIVDKFGGTTGTAKQVGITTNETMIARGTKGSNHAQHSQANALLSSGLEYVKEENEKKMKKENQGVKPKNVTNVVDKKNKVHSFVSFGSAENWNDTSHLMNSLGYTYSGAITQKGDPVAQIVGGNGSVHNQDATLVEKVFNIVPSAHGNYICQNYANLGVNCGYRK